MLTDKELDDIEARLKFYEGEYWRVNESDPFVVDVLNSKATPMPPLLQSNKFQRDEIAVFIAHAPEDVQNLVDEIRRLKKGIRACAETSAEAARQLSQLLEAEEEGPSVYENRGVTIIG